MLFVKSTLPRNRRNSTTRSFGSSPHTLRLGDYPGSGHYQKDFREIDELIEIDLSRYINSLRAGSSGLQGAARRETVGQPLMLRSIRLIFHTRGPRGYEIRSQPTR